MTIYFNIAQIVLSLALVLMVLFQVKGGGLGGIFGQPDTVYRTRRGVEKVMFQLTVVLTILFVITSVLSVRFGV